MKSIKNTKFEDRKKSVILTPVTKIKLIKILGDKTIKNLTFCILLISFIIRALLHIIRPVLLINFCGNFLWIGLSFFKVHCVKSVRIWSYSGQYFPEFGRNTERYGISLRIQSESGKKRTRITPYMDNFHAVVDTKFFHKRYWVWRYFKIFWDFTQYWLRIELLKVDFML